MHALWVLSLALVLGFKSPQAGAEEIALAQNPPQRYTVVQGDTLWDIAARFLKHPWQWPKIWKANPHIHNPNRIYPGDVLILEYQNGQPYLVLKRGEQPALEKLTPKIRETPIQQPIPTIPYEAVRQFLTTPKVVTKEEIESAPYIVGLANRRLIGGSGDKIYVRGGKLRDSNYTVFRQGKALKDPETNEVLGYNAIYVADVYLTQTGDPATFTLAKSVREVLVGDRLLPATEEAVVMDYHPHPPSRDITGHIIEFLDGVSQIGRYSVVVIDRGLRDGLEPGHVLEIWRHGAKVLDTVGPSASEWVALPAERSGLVLIFRPFARVSYGLVMEANAPIYLGDQVKRP
ncbi:LysM peptidoglycan-binding domain-containing protein [Methylothermus subterraneus]